MQASRIVSWVSLSRHSSRQLRAAGATRQRAPTAPTLLDSLRVTVEAAGGYPRVGAVRRLSCSDSIRVALLVVVSAGQDVVIRGLGFDFRDRLGAPRCRE